MNLTERQELKELKELKELEEKIVAQVEKRKAEGWKVRRHRGTVTRLQDGTCTACALGCFANPIEYGCSYLLVAGRALGLHPWDASDFAMGFDGREWGYLADPDFYALGQRVAERVL